MFMSTFRLSACSFFPVIEHIWAKFGGMVHYDLGSRSFRFIQNITPQLFIKTAIPVPPGSRVQFPPLLS